MSDTPDERCIQPDDDPKGSTVSRRQFLKMAGVAGAAVGVGGGLGGLLAACGDDEETTTTAGATETTAGGTETTAGGTETTAGGTETTAGGEMGREVKVGWVTMTTGVFAGLSEPDDFLLNQAKEAIGDGLVGADGMVHPVAWVVKDSQSDTNRAAEVTSELITQDKPDLITGGMTPVVNIPVGTQCEANGVPCVTYGCPMEAWFDGMGGDFANPTQGFNWAYNIFFSMENLITVYTNLLSALPTNMKLAILFPNDPDGVQFNNILPPAMEAAGFTNTNPGLFTNGTEDFSSVISQFKADGCECLLGAFNPPDFANFWKQSVQNGFSPKTTSIARAILTRPAMDAVGDIGNGLCLEVWWEKTWPYTSSLTGLTCQGIVDAWEAVESGPYSPALGLTGGGCFDVVTDVIQRTADLDDPASYVEAIKATDLDTIVGHIKFDAPVANSALSPIVGGQWIGSVGAWERNVATNGLYPDIPITGEVVDRTTL